NAGYTTGIIHNQSAKLPAVLAVVLNSLFSEVVIYKCYSFACAMIGALCVPLALSLFGFDIRVVLVGAIFGIMLWWVSLFHWFHTTGMVSFTLVSYIALPYLAA